MGWSTRSFCNFLGTHTLGSFGCRLLFGGAGETSEGAGVNNSGAGFILPGATFEIAIIGTSVDLRCQEVVALFRLAAPVLAPPLAM